MQVVLVYLQPFHRNSVLKCALHPVTSACYDKQHVYLSATVFTL